MLNVTAVAIDGRGLLLCGAPGRGKSTLALELLDRGATLIGDDGIVVAVRDDAIWLAPPDGQTRGLIEIFGIGFLTVPVTDAPLALILDLDRTPPRLPETLETREIAGHAIPVLGFAPHRADAIRAEHALRLHGLAHGQ